LKKMAGEFAGSDIRLIRIRFHSSEHIQERLEEIFRLSDALIAIPDMNIYNFHGSYNYKASFQTEGGSGTGNGGDYSSTCNREIQG